ncbi:MAG: hypothetical protein UX13_C0024G0002 [Candidatus Woesebacteria bacterium GW2011_GWB1_45_5]|uniref:Uncharacterized protein n=1 Tax=Candidatus Woesebacteria bacterium GW2011_GWB1_45_5 TaxID=1618581 RepID=A0A0G1QMU3_9BACT|nr:MAG: hypothetical protein UX13_C0024G0002 [Candidatus Woesebacteria bacterium GW2011_GWB1_45_5]
MERKKTKKCKHTHPVLNAPWARKKPEKGAYSAPQGLHVNGFSRVHPLLSRRFKTRSTIQSTFFGWAGMSSRLSTLGKLSDRESRTMMLANLFMQSLLFHCWACMQYAALVFKVFGLEKPTIARRGSRAARPNPEKPARKPRLNAREIAPISKPRAQVCLGRLPHPKQQKRIDRRTDRYKYQLRCILCGG